MKKFIVRSSFSRIFVMLLCGVFLSSLSHAEDKKKKEENSDTIKSATVSGLKFRSIGPAFTSGRIADFAVNPSNTAEYYIAVASGHIWKTVNNGNTFDPVFDNYGAYSIGCLAMDPKNSSVVWAGTGENNHQRSLGYGDGVYKTIDGGKAWKNMGLKESRQIGMIAIDPTNTDIVYVAAEGSVWGPGGDRGLYKTADGGKTWEKILTISENTGVNNVVMDPRDSKVLYATAEQRRRHVFTKIGGGPETAIYKSVDAGKTWDKLTNGIPDVDKGGIGLAISPVDPDVLYVIFEASGDAGGFYRTTDRGASWSKMSDHFAQGQYYDEIYCDPKNVDKVYSVETVSQFTTDAGKTWKAIGNNERHVDDHALWIDPCNTMHFMIGGDGGVYETFDAGQNYYFKTNLPVTQFYRVSLDNSKPFYWVYGGTQDNNSFGGPSRNTSRDGVPSCEWVVTLGGDGFWQAIDPKNPDIVYSEYQYGNLFRYDKKSGERTFIKPQPLKGEETYKWNWNTPVILSPHSNTRLYIAANKVFRSDDRGQSWKVISGDITAQIDRNTWPVMGRYWGIDAVGKDISTSLYGTAISLVESPVKEDLLYVGTDDGVIQVTEDIGQNWRKIDKFPGVPENTYVSDIFASRFDENIVFASFDNILRDDFKPYLLKSTDKGKSWTSIAGNLPEKHTVHTIQQDFINPDLMFAGTEFGIFFTVDGGKIWTQLTAGMPTIAVEDMAIQERECDLVLATFGRGFYILDDYSPLRLLNKDLLDKDSYLFPVKDALMYIQTGGRYGQGSNYYVAKNPDFGATFTYYLKDVPKTLKDMRQDREKDLIKDKKPIPIPPMDSIRAEENEVAPYLLFTIKDEQGNIVRKIPKSPSKGISRIAWDLRYSGPYPVEIPGEKFDPFSNGGSGMMVMPGKYNVSMAIVVRGVEKELAEPVGINAVVLNNTTLPPENRAALVAFQKRVSALTMAVTGADDYTGDLIKRVQYIRQAIQNTPQAPFDLMQRADKVRAELDEIYWKFHGQPPKASDEENLPAPPPLFQRLDAITSVHWSSTSDVTQTQRDQFELIDAEFPPLVEQLKTISDKDITELNAELDKLGAPWTPGRLPEWKK
jgi:photosystem II stability/assembly factor-like uncharacterized protein